MGAAIQGRSRQSHGSGVPVSPRQARQSGTAGVSPHPDRQGHGGLHLYDKGSELAKITWSRTGIPLIDQIRGSLDEGRYPLVVTEGTSTQKVTRILHSAYLNHAIRSFSKIGGALFIFGHSLAANDEHLLRRIADGRITRLYVSIYGDPRDEVNAAIALRATDLAARRPVRKPLVLHFYDAESAHVWG